MNAELLEACKLAIDVISIGEVGGDVAAYNAMKSAIKKAEEAE